MKKWLIVLLVFLVIIGAWLHDRNTTLTEFSESVEVIDDLIIEEYMGVWYDVASIPNRFQKGLTNVTATYELREDGSVRVFNAGIKPDGAISDIEGEAEMFSEGRFKVSFFPLVKSDYNLLYIDEFYSYALVGGGNPDYLWILSRTPKLDERVIQGLLDKAEKQGYNVDKMENNQGAE